MANNITRANVLSAIVNGDMEFLQSTEAREVAAKMLASITRKPAKSDKPSKAATENVALAEKVLAYMPAGEVVHSADIMAHVNGILTPQKCAKVMAVLLNAGKVEKVKGRYTGYKLV